MSVKYEDICAWENLFEAWKRAAKGKRGRKAVAGFEYKLEDRLCELSDELTAQTYEPGPYRSFYIHEPKQRLISAAPFRDRIVHHALCIQMEPIFEKSFIHDSYANRLDKGTHRALDRAQYWSRKFRYVLQCDVKQYFPSIDHEMLMILLKRKISDIKVLWLCAKILSGGTGVLSEEYEMHYFPGDDLLAALRPRGLPIGNLTSQFFANCFLNPLDHFVQRELRIPAYLRYVDDFLLFANDKAQLWEAKNKIIERLQKYRITIHTERAQVRPVSEGIPFLGFQVFPQYRLLKRRKGVYFQQKLSTLLTDYHDGLIPYQQVKASLQGWINHVRYGDTWGLRTAILKPVSVKFFRENDARRDDHLYAHL